ncbi:MAG: hypothetical protein Q7J34_11425 [Bacteroidales bacterium]|nr:hypothetical protein [Bacteroidales bacterium]
MAIEIKEVKDKKQFKEFLSLPFSIYKDNPFWVPSLFMEERRNLNPKHNPAFEWSKTCLWLAYKDGKPAGRIAGIINHKSNQIWGKKQARFGWIDFIDDEEVSTALFNTLENWARENGMNSVHGPLGFSDMDKEGMLTFGFDELGTIATIYNHAYYPEHTIKNGYSTDTEWVEYELKKPDGIPEKHLKIAEIVKQRFGLRVFQAKKSKDILPYAKQIFHLVNEAFADLYGYVALTEKQMDYYIKLYFTFVRAEYIPIILDKNDDVIAFGITLPSLSKAMQKTGGKLFPFGFFHLLKAMKKNDRVDFYLIAVKPEYQNKGVNALLFTDLIPKYARDGIQWAETNVELIDNEKVRKQWDYFEKRIHKRRSAFIKHL